MRINSKILIGMIAGLFLAGVFWFGGQPNPIQPNLPEPPVIESVSKEAQDADGVIATAAPQVTDTELRFLISLDTHAGELNQDLTQSVLKDGTGKILVLKSWQGDPPGGHHRSGMLAFENPQGWPVRLNLPGFKELEWSEKEISQP